MDLLTLVLVRCTSRDDLGIGLLGADNEFG